MACAWGPAQVQVGENVRPRTMSGASRIKPVVGVTGFEPAASSSRTTRATKLRHTPWLGWQLYLMCGCCGNRAHKGACCRMSAVTGRRDRP